MSRTQEGATYLPSAKTPLFPVTRGGLPSVSARMRKLSDRLARYACLQTICRTFRRLRKTSLSNQTSLAAHRVPPELFQTIIREFNIQTGAHLPTATFSRSKKELKRYLSNVSLVCRYWAQNIRAAIFEELQLQSPEDAHQLLAFARNVTLDMSVGRYVREITLETTLPCTPWLHLVVHTLPRALFPRLERYTYGFSPDTKNKYGWFAPRNVFVGLPRALPVPRLPVRPRLKWLDFAHFADLVAFVDSLFAARAHPAGGDAPFRFNTLSFYYVTWADNGEQVPAQVPQAFVGARRYWRKRVGDVHVVNCSAAWPLLWLLVRTERPRGPTPVSVHADLLQHPRERLEQLLERAKIELEVLGWLAPWECARVLHEVEVHLCDEAVEGEL
ncbi:hypothetical protein PsYK624_128630 [Phanerochaete sordida]|uniref:Uncharacterized protein n=1 Tax=Phanerochaete sordida TaxID=48140 RepID=A0A9P3GK40_9APHY|nr:hypothetical protein PsYK624_128630 [Phanerochaete sordida]